MARMVAVSLMRPCFHSQSRSSPSAGRCGRDSVTSPPSSASPWRSKLGAQRIGQRADAGDDGDAQRHAGDEDVEAR